VIVVEIAVGFSSGENLPPKKAMIQ